MGISGQKIYSWAYETKVAGDVSADLIAEAAMQFRAAVSPRQDGGLVWVIDIKDVDIFSLSRSIISGIEQQVSNLTPMGLGRLAIIPPDLDPEMINQYLSEIKVSVEMRLFPSRKDVIDWLRRGCR